MFYIKNTSQVNIELENLYKHTYIHKYYLYQHEIKYFICNTKRRNLPIGNIRKIFPYLVNKSQQFR